MHSELYKVLTFAEATELWGLNESTLRKAIVQGERLEEGVDYRKSGRIWLIRRASMERLYGKLQEK